ncbi:MAG: thermonuclease family protein [Pseudomonadales bacterium]|nr:thermonuclease family protein [Gammaproteobacteria bacterium]NNL57613.1 thermonuclease family protein [Pseudomonadales bacterium]
MSAAYPRHRFALLIVFIAAFAYAASEIWPAASAKQAAGHITGLCTHVVDGDSLYLQGHKSQVRLWGVDAPERNERGYAAAKAALRELAQGRTLHCEQQDIDKYKRVVARCFITHSSDEQKPSPRKGREINRLLIERGVASEYCWFSKGFYGHCRRGRN